MTGPPLSVLRAFGLDPIVKPVLLEGGQGTSWRVGDAVLKPLDSSEEETETEFVLQIQEQLCRRDNREYSVLEPLAGSDGITTSRYIVEGWTGTRFVLGTHAKAADYNRTLPATRSFHRDLVGIFNRQPAIFRSRTSRWAVADRIAWDEDYSEQDDSGPVNHLLPSFIGLYHRLMDLKRPLSSNSYTNQLVHLDLLGNILFRTQGPPTIIDLSLYWRPVDYAEAIFVVDALTDQDASDDLILGTGDLSQTRFQMLVRAMLFRIFARNIDALDRGDLDGKPMDEHFHKACEAIERVFSTDTERPKT